MATAVSLWSPVIITGRMPALAAARRMASFTSGRTGSIIPARPMQGRGRCSRISGFSVLRQAAGPEALPPPRARAAPYPPWRGSPRGFRCAFPPAWGGSARPRRRPHSGAAPHRARPCVYWTKPLSVRWMVDIILRVGVERGLRPRGAAASRRRRLSQPLGCVGEVHKRRLGRRRRCSAAVR